MNYDLLFKQAEEKGIEAIEIYEQSNKKTSISLFKLDVDKFQIASTEVLAVRGLFNGKMGTTYTENLSDDNIEQVLNDIVANASAIENEDVQEIYPGDEKYTEFSNFNDSVLSVSVANKIAKLKEIEEKAMAASDKFDNVSANYTEAYDKVIIKNSNGIDLIKEDVYFYFYIQALAKEGEERTSGYVIEVSRDFDEKSADEIVAELIEETLPKLGASPIESNMYETILHRDAATSLLGVLINSFSADTVQKGSSKLAGKLEEKIFGQNITITDDPFRKDGWGSGSFDDEGVATKVKDIVKDGVLKTFLHNLKTAKKDNVESTGNGFKAGVKGGVSVSPTNIFIQPGETSYDDMLVGFSGVVIKGLAGTHAGTNPISGDFSLQADGFLYEDGKVVQPINLVTLSGNIYDVLNSVNVIASDLKFVGSGHASPTLNVGKMQISGK
jgi:PmbA protein